VTLLLLLPIVLLPDSQAAAATGRSILISPAALAARPASGPAWRALVAVANGSLGTADLTDQNNQHGVRTLGVALVAARTGSTTLRTKARNAIMSAIGTEQVGAGNSILALGRQLGAYVMAAGLIGLSGADDATFRAWLGPDQGPRRPQHLEFARRHARGLGQQLGRIRGRVADRGLALSWRHGRRRAGGQGPAGVPRGPRGLCRLRVVGI
jgi:hypothetical protein